MSEGPALEEKHDEPLTVESLQALLRETRYYVFHAEVPHQSAYDDQQEMLKKIDAAAPPPPTHPYVFHQCEKDAECNLGKGHTGTAMTSRSDRPADDLPEVIWVGTSAVGELVASPNRPDHGQATKYFRVKDWRQIEKLALNEGVESDQYVTLLFERSEAQRREIARLHGQLKEARDRQDNSPSFSPNFDERNRIK